MPVDIVVPQLGESVTEGTVATWLVQVGAAVTADQPLVELETDKATLEIVAPKAGVLSEILVAEGEDVLVGAVLGRIEEGAAPAREPDREAKAPAAEVDRSEAAQPSASTATPLPAAAAETSALDPTTIGRSGAEGRVTLPDLMAWAGEGSAEALERSGPAVRKLVADHDLDPAELRAGGPGGRIRVEDVRARLEHPAAPPTRAAAVREERVKMSRMRRTIAARLKEAQNTAAILTTFNEIDMNAVKELRRRFRDGFEARHGVRLGFNSFFVKAAVAALREFPAVNAEIDGGEIVYKHYYDIGIAVSAPSGLVVPVVRDCDQKSFSEIERSVEELASRAREGELTLEEMTGGTFSISNGGVFGSLMSTPILNLPQSAILGLHKIEDRPVAIEGRVEIRPMMYVALSYDHRIVDGREAVSFLVRIKQCVEDPERLLLDA
jgi:2-oxoglutarate dehydrogenase E2 component (dihydrolipoamide succinyltransferase)